MAQRAMAKMATMAIVVLLAASGARAATGTQPVRGESVLTLRIDGDLTIDPEGRVMEYRIRTALDPQVRKLVARAVPNWRFQPILLGGRPIAAKSPMRITLAATQANGGYEVRVDNVVFRPNTEEEYEAEQASQRLAAEKGLAIETASAGKGDPEPAPQPVMITSRKLTPPGYPTGLMRAGVEGAVLLNLRLNPDGTVAETFVAQSSLLNIKGRAQFLDRVRAMLEKNAAAAARTWRFDVEAAQPSILKPGDLTVRIPVEYVLSTPGADASPLTGKWRNEFRGPISPAPWLTGEDDQPAVGVSDLNAGEFLAGTSPFKLTDKSVIGTAL